MVPADFAALSGRRAHRARQLAANHETCREPLLFVAAIAEFQGRVAPQAPLNSLAELIAIVTEHGPPLLGNVATGLDEPACLAAIRAYETGRDTHSPRAFFARVLSGPVAASRGAAISSGAAAGQLDNLDACPCCGQPPQVGCTRADGDGTTLSLVCSLCLAEWAYPSGRCPACTGSDPRQIAWFGDEAGNLPGLQVRACESCQRYVNVVDIEHDPAIVPDVDEIVALPLDLWARQRGLRKIQANLAGI